MTWFNRIGEGLSELENRFDGFHPETLAENEDFISAVYETTSAAMKSNNDAKRDRLKNAVLNMAAGRSVSDALRGRFISLLQTFSEEHILLLKLCNDPLIFPCVAAMRDRMSMGARVNIFEEEFRHHGVSGSLVALWPMTYRGNGLSKAGFKPRCQDRVCFSRQQQT